MNTPINICRHLMHDHRGQYIGTLQFVPPANAEQIAKERDEALAALKLWARHYDDLSKSNPGFMGKMVLQNYALWNDALLAMAKALSVNSTETKGGESE